MTVNLRNPLRRRQPATLNAHNAQNQPRHSIVRHRSRSTQRQNSHTSRLPRLIMITSRSRTSQTLNMRLISRLTLQLRLLIIRTNNGHHLTSISRRIKRLNPTQGLTRRLTRRFTRIIRLTPMLLRIRSLNLLNPRLLSRLTLNTLRDLRLLSLTLSRPMMTTNRRRRRSRHHRRMLSQIQPTAQILRIRVIRIRIHNLRNITPPTNTTPLFSSNFLELVTDIG